MATIARQSRIETERLGLVVPGEGRDEGRGALAEYWTGAQRHCRRSRSSRHHRIPARQLAHRIVSWKLLLDQVAGVPLASGPTVAG